MRILTFDIEEWFHILDNNSTKTQSEWSQYESRIHKNMERIYELLEIQKIKATFFVLGWIAEKYPEVVKTINQLGHEVGSHTYMHQLMYEQKAPVIREDLYRSISILEDITGKKVVSFRAPGFSITKNNQHVFSILHEFGIERDCSLFPASRAHGGMPEFSEAEPSIISINGVTIKEFPINTTNILGKRWIFSGGGYFRITPLSFIKYFTKKSSYIMTYFHPRDFDADQPMIKELPYLRRFKSYIGLRNCQNKLQNWIKEFGFVDLESADKLIDWTKAPLVKLS